MSPEELAAVAWVAGVKEGGDAASTIHAVVQRLGQTVGSQSLETAVVERDCLTWLGNRLHFSLSPDTQTASAANRLFAPLLAQATRLTLPIWRIAGHMVAFNSKIVRQDGLDLLERVFTRVVPSADALQVLREMLATLPPDGTIMSGIEMSERVRDDLTAVAAHTDWVETTLLLVLLLGFSDGKFNKEEERFYLAVAQRLGSSLENAQTMRDQTTATFWSRRARLAPRNTEKPSEVRANSLRAAYDTLEHVGAIAKLTSIVTDACVQAADDRSGGKSQKISWPMRLIAHFTGGGGRRDFTVMRISLLSYIRSRAVDTE